MGAPRDQASPPFGRARIITRERVVAGGMAGRVGGASRDRTGDLLVANQTLSQLSYGPSSIGENRRDDFRETLHGYRAPRERPWARCAEEGFPKTWWVWEELHLRPHPYQGCALTN